MNKMKFATIAALACTGLLLCATVVLPRMRLQNGEGKAVDLTYTGAVSEGDELIIYADYQRYGDSFDIARDIRVAADRNMSSVLRGSSKPEDGRYVYRFPLAEPVDIVYIEPPVLYVPKEIETVSSLLKNGEIFKLGDKDWLLISSVEITEPQGGLCTVTVHVEPYSDELPRLPQLVIGEKRQGGFTSHEFDGDAHFLWGEFQYQLPAVSAAELKERLEGAKLEISSILHPITADGTVFTSNAKRLEVIPVN